MRKVFYLLGELTDGDVEWLLEHGHKEQIATGTVLIHEGQATNRMFILLLGTLEVSFASRGLSPAAGCSPPSVRLSSGEVIGEMSFIDARPPSATVTAVEPSIVFAIPRDALAKHLNESSAFAARFYRALALFLSHRLRSTVKGLGYSAGRPLSEEVEDPDELDPNALKGVHVGGARFNRVLQRLLAP